MTGTAGRRNVTAGVVVAAVLATGAGCGSGGQGQGEGSQRGLAAPKRPRHAVKPMRLIGDGSTAYTGAQPGQPRPERLRPGTAPPQFVVFSWDGAGEDGQKLFSHFREVGRKYDATMTYFLSGVYLVPTAVRRVYDPPRHQRGSSDIGFNDIDGIKNTLDQLGAAWREGNEIGTHFNGHFCGPDGGVGTWTTGEWLSETRQAESFVRNWRTNSGLTRQSPLPFDYSTELVGGRAPCLEGQRHLVPAAKKLGFRYDASSSGGLQVWPGTIDGIWDFPLQQIPMPGRSFETLSMDYNFLANQSGTTRGDPAMHAAWGRQLRDGLFAALNRAYHGNRAPLLIGNHFESWNGGTYMRAVEQVIKDVCPGEEVRCVSFKQLADWLDAQDPEVLEKLRALDVGERPAGGWAHYLAAPPHRAPTPTEPHHRGAPHGSTSPRRTPHGGAPERGAPDGGAPERGASDRGMPDRDAHRRSPHQEGTPGKGSPYEGAHHGEEGAHHSAERRSEESSRRADARHPAPSRRPDPRRTPDRHRKERRATEWRLSWWRGR